MHSHAPQDYSCPFCNFIGGAITPRNSKDDIVYRTNTVTAFIAPGTWPNNRGHVIVIPNKHFENIYDISDDAMNDVYKVAKKVAIAIRATYGCDGTSTRQHNEPAGDQDLWHFHVHVFPRYEGDRLYLTDRINIDAAERAPYAEKLRAYFAEHAD